MRLFFRESRWDSSLESLDDTLAAEESLVALESLDETLLQDSLKSLSSRASKTLEERLD